MFIAQQLMLLVLRNAFEILVLTAVNHSETDWNIRHAFRIWATLIILEVRGRLSVYPEKKNKKSEIAKKKFGSRRFRRVGRSTANRQNFKDGPRYHKGKHLQYDS